MKWVATERKYHGDLEVGARFLIHEPGATRGVCQCWEPDTAFALAGVLSAVGFVDPASLSASAAADENGGAE